MFPTAALYLYLIWIPTLRRSQRRKSMRQCDQSMIWVWDCGGSTVGGGRLLRLELEKDFIACFPPRILGLNIILYFSTKSFQRALYLIFVIISGKKVGREEDSWSTGSPVPRPDWEDSYREGGCLWYRGAYQSNILIYSSSGPGGKVISALTARAGGRGVPETPSREVVWRGKDGRSVSGATKNTTILI